MKFLEKMIEQKINQVIENQNKLFAKSFETLLLLSFKGKNITEASKELYNSYPKAEGFIKYIQFCNLCLMKELKEVCDSLNIKFWLHAGTLIGAIRHQGFIPWDDDVDVAMTKEDFLILKKNLTNNNKLILEEFYNRRTCSRQYQLKFKNELPIFIDIVQYDMTNARTPQECEEFWLKYRTIYKKNLVKFKEKLKSNNVIDVGYDMLCKYDNKTKNYVDKLIDDAITKINPSNYIENPSWYYSIENYPFSYPIMKNEELFPLLPVKFENTSFYIPNDFAKYLQPYGNIWHPPGDIGINSHVYAFESKRKIIEEYCKTQKEFK